jgi:hypothetical protein
VVCQEWRGKGGFERFLADMGERPASDMTLDRTDVNGNYCKSNCRWADKHTQRVNIRVLPKPQPIPRKNPKKKIRKRKPSNGKRAAKVPSVSASSAPEPCLSADRKAA